MADTDILIGQNGDGAAYYELNESNNNSTIKVYPFDGLAAEDPIVRHEPGVGGTYVVMPKVVLRTALIDDISDTDLVDSPNTTLNLPVGLYRVTVGHWVTSTADAGRLRTTITWGNPIMAGTEETSQPAPEVDLSVTATVPTTGSTIICSVGGGWPITYRCELLGVSGGPPVYNVFIALEALLRDAA